MPGSSGQARLSPSCTVRAASVHMHVRAEAAVAVDAAAAAVAAAAAAVSVAAAGCSSLCGSWLQQLPGLGWPCRQERGAWPRWAAGED